MASSIRLAESTPLQSLLGGFGVALAAHELLILNGSVFGISGFINRSVKGDREALASVAGLVASGAVIAMLGDVGNTTQPTLSICKALISGLLVGVGTKLANGCTSGHMICGVARFSRRSIIATASFFASAVVTANIVHKHDNSLPEITNAAWALTSSNVSTIYMQLVTMLGLGLIHRLGYHVLHVPPVLEKSDSDKPTNSTLDTGTHPSSSSLILLRSGTSFLTSLQFGLALSLSGLSRPERVLGFLLFPQRYIFPRLTILRDLKLGDHFDPSLFFVAASAMPLAIFLYQFARRQGQNREQAKLGGAEKWAVPTNRQVDASLIIGSFIFGVGWGTVGICPGPALINFGAAITTQNLLPIVSWLGSMIVGGYLAS